MPIYVLRRRRTPGRHPHPRGLLSDRRRCRCPSCSARPESWAGFAFFGAAGPERRGRLPGGVGPVVGGSGRAMKRILVIGGYGGFGARLSRRLAAAGHHVLVAGRSADKAARFAATLAERRAGRRRPRGRSGAGARRVPARSGDRRGRAVPGQRLSRAAGLHRAPAFPISTSPTRAASSTGSARSTRRRGRPEWR